MPRFTDATYGGETNVIENGAMRVEFHKRTTGWGWTEIYTGAGKFMGVLEHLGEVRLPGNILPARLEADAFTETSGNYGTRLAFDLVETTPEAMTRRSEQTGPFYQRRDAQPTQPLFAGTAVFTLAHSEPVLSFQFECHALMTVSIASIRGPWLKAGVETFGAAKTDAILGGVDWCIDDEWSSGTNWFTHPWALRVAPNPLKVSVPFMGVSHDDAAIGLAWDPDMHNRFHMAHHYQQPVFASPNFVDRRNEHLMGLMFPAAMEAAEENRLEAVPPFTLLPGMNARFEGAVLVGEGDSLDLLAGWISRKGMPAPPQPRYEIKEALDRIARAYDAHLWHEGKGWGMSSGDAAPRQPLFVKKYIQRASDAKTARGLSEKLAWVRAHGNASDTGAGAKVPLADLDESSLRAYADSIVSRQREDGAFCFDPHGQHGASGPIHNFTYCEDTYKPLVPYKWSFVQIDKDFM